MTENAPLTDADVLLRCACGWETTGTEAEVVAAATDHGARVHIMHPTREEVLAMITYSDAIERPRQVRAAPGD